MVTETLLQPIRDSFPDLPQPALQNLERYLGILYKWNRAKSLTRIDESESVSKLILPSLWLRRFVVGLPEQTILDLGTGAGIPGVPLSVCLPEHRFVLLDRSQKKIAFIKQVIRELTLSNVTAVCMDTREFVTEKGSAGGFDWVFCRSFGPTEKVVQVSRTLLKKEGILVFQKGEKRELETDRVLEDLSKSEPIRFLGSTRIGAGIEPSAGKLFLVQNCSTWNN